MHVGDDVTCMYTNFGGCGLSGFGDMANFQKQPNFPFRPWTIESSPWYAKNLMFAGIHAEIQRRIFSFL